MATITKAKLSGSTDGKGILVAASTTPGTAIHTATALTGDNWDEVWLWAVNTDSADRKLTLELGGTTAGFIDEVTIPTEGGYILVVPGFIFQNAAALAAFAAAGSVVNIIGFVNQIRA
jgi:hypothetical protein